MARAGPGRDLDLLHRRFLSLAGAASTIPRAGVLRIGEIASLVLHSDAWSRVPGDPGREVATGEVTGDLTDAAARPARGSWFSKARRCSTGLR
jgi:hypothetical protein